METINFQCRLLFITNVFSDISETDSREISPKSCKKKPAEFKDIAQTPEAEGKAKDSSV